MSRARRVVGVLGGTFNPIHNGHLVMARESRTRLELAEVLLLPCAVPPHKEAPRSSTPEDRVAMLEAAIAGEAGLAISLIEVHAGRPCYTIDTLRRLRHGGWNLDPVFIMGMDSLLDLPTWRDYRALLAEFDLVVVDRAHRESFGERTEAAIEERVVRVGEDRPPPADLGRGGRVLLLDVAPPAISSREIRAQAGAGEALDPLVPPGVARYIRDKRLYSAAEEDRR